MKSTVVFLNRNKFLVRLGLILAAWTFSDTIVDLFLSVIHSLVMLLHYLFELLEHTLDALVEHLFHTDPRTTEIIVFYILFLLTAAVMFKFVSALPGWCRAICAHCVEAWTRRKNEAIDRWQSQSFAKKIKWGSLFVTGSLFMVIWAIN